MKRSPRYLLLPPWIRVFAWIFLVIGTACAVMQVLGAIVNTSASFKLHGLRYSGSLREPTACAFGAVFAFYGYTAYLLLWGKKTGRKAGLAAGYLGLALCSISMVTSFFADRLYITFDPLLQVPFVMKLHHLKGQWEDEAHTLPASELPP